MEKWWATLDYREYGLVHILLIKVYRSLMLRYTYRSRLANAWIPFAAEMRRSAPFV